MIREAPRSGYFGFSLLYEPSFIANCALVNLKHICEYAELLYRYYNKKQAEGMHQDEDKDRRGEGLKCHVQWNIAELEAHG